MLGPVAGGLGGAATGSFLGSGARQGGGIFDLLAPLDYPRQALWNVPTSLGKGDFLGALPGLLGGAAGLGLAATGAGLPMALLGGSALGGLAQGVGRSTGRETFDAPTPSALLEALGGDPETMPGMLGSLALGALGDPLMWSQLGLGVGRLKPRFGLGRGGTLVDDIPIPHGSEVLGAKPPLIEVDLSTNPLHKLATRAPGGEAAVDAAFQAGATPEQMTKAAGAGYANRNKDLAQQAVDYHRIPEGTPLDAKPTTAPPPLKQTEIEGQLQDYLKDHGPNADPAVVKGMADEIHALQKTYKGGKTSSPLQLRATQREIETAAEPHMAAAHQRVSDLRGPAYHEAAQQAAEDAYLAENPWDQLGEHEFGPDPMEAVARARSAGLLPPIPPTGTTINPNVPLADFLDNSQHSALLKALAGLADKQNWLRGAMRPPGA